MSAISLSCSCGAAFSCDASTPFSLATNWLDRHTDCAQTAAHLKAHALAHARPAPFDVGQMVRDFVRIVSAAAPAAAPPAQADGPRLALVPTLPTEEPKP